MSTVTRRGKLHFTTYTSALAIAVVAGGFATSARAEDILTSLDNLAAPILASDGTVTHYGITLFGTYDINANFETHGADNNNAFAQTSDYLVSPSGRNTGTSISGNGLSQTQIGLKGKEEIFDGLSVVFRGDTALNPLTGQIADSEKALTQNSAAHTTASGLQTPNSDSTRAGQPLNGNGWIGISNPVGGQITFGRHNTPLLDAVTAADPLSGSYAFSLVGFSSVASGGGVSEDARLDKSLRYSNSYGPFRLAALYQLSGTTLRNGNDDGYQVDIGADYHGLSIDAVFAVKHNALKTGALSTSTTAFSATGGGSGDTAAVGAGLDPSKTVTATLSDNTSYALLGSYVPAEGVKVKAGYEIIYLSDPHNAGSITQSELEKYAAYQVLLTSTSLTTYAKTAIFQYMWTGASFKVAPDVTLSTAFYHLIQNDFTDYVGSSNAITVQNGSTTKSSAGQENVVSFVADYQLTKRLDLYSGLAYSQVGGGLDYQINSSNKFVGYFNNNNFTGLIGARFIF